MAVFAAPRAGLPGSSVAVSLALESLHPFLVRFVGLLPGRRNIDFVALVVLDPEKLDELPDDAGRVGGQLVIGHQKRRNLVDVEPSAPSEILLFDVDEAMRDHFAVIDQNRFRPFLHPRRPGVRLQRFGHGHRLGDLVLAADVDVGRRRQHLQQLRIFPHESLEMMEMRLHSEDAIPRSAAGEQFDDIIGGRRRLEAVHQHAHFAGGIQNLAGSAEKAGLPQSPAKILAARPIRGGDDVGFPERPEVIEVEAFVDHITNRPRVNGGFHLGGGPVNSRGGCVTATDPARRFDGYHARNRGRQSNRRSPASASQSGAIETRTRTRTR